MEMLVERGVVTDISGEIVTVQCRSRMDCQRCADGKGCGGGILARWLGDRQFQIQARFDHEEQIPKIGHQIEIALPANRIVQLAAIIYGLPLLLVVLLLVLQTLLVPSTSDLPSIFLALAGLFVGFKLSSLLVKRANRHGALLPVVQKHSKDYFESIPSEHIDSICQSISGSKEI